MGLATAGSVSVEDGTAFQFVVFCAAVTTYIMLFVHRIRPYIRGRGDASMSGKRAGLRGSELFLAALGDRVKEFLLVVAFLILSVLIHVMLNQFRRLGWISGPFWTASAAFTLFLFILGQFVVATLIFIFLSELFRGGND